MENDDLGEPRLCPEHQSLIIGNAVLAVHTQCKIFYVGKYSNPSFGPLGKHLTRHARGACTARRFSLVVHPSTHSSYPGGPSSRDLGPDP